MKELINNASPYIKYYPYINPYPLDKQHTITSPITNNNKQKRNDLCNCGSNIKYKKCCLNKTNEIMIKEIEPNTEIKGIFNGNCNRTACQKPHATYYNFSTKVYYCASCADMINNANRADAIKLYGHELCIHQNKCINENEEYNEIIIPIKNNKTNLNL